MKNKKKTRKKIFPAGLIFFIVIWIVVSTIACYFRLYPLRTYVPDEISEKASLLVVNKLRAEMQKTIDQVYPSMPAVQKRQLVKKEFDKLLREEKLKVRKSINDISKKLAEETPSVNKVPYLLGSDSYNYLDLTMNIQETGAISDTVKGSKYVNRKGTAPITQLEPLTLHPYVGYLVHKIISFFKKDSSLIYNISFTPLIITVLALIPFLLLCSTLKLSRLTTFISSLYLVLAPVFLRRSMYGWYDNDPYNILFPAITLLIFCRLLIKEQKILLHILGSCIGVLSIICYTLFWHGWLFLVNGIGLSLVIIFFYNLFFVKNTKDLKAIPSSIATLVIVLIAGITIIYGKSEFYTLFNEALTAYKGFTAPQISIWPDLYIAVGELKASSLGGIIGLTGGVLYFLIAFFGITVSLIKAVRFPSKDKNPIFIVAVFFLLSLFVTLKAERFALLCVMPLSLSFGLGLKEIFDFLHSDYVEDFLSERNIKYMRNITAGLICFMLVFIPLKRARDRTPELLNKIFNSTWEDVLTKIKNQTPQDSIINTWWPPGHFIKAYARRGVTFDGSSLNTPQAYWMARVLLSQNETAALGFLRMLNDSSASAVEYLTKNGFEVSKAVQILERITPLNYNDARLELLPRLGPGKTEWLLDMTHRTPPPSYLLLYNDLVEKNILLSFVGNWDFKRVEDIKEDKKAQEQLLSKGKEAYVKFAWEVAGGQPRYSGPLSLIGWSKNQLIFDKNVIIDIEKMRVIINSAEFGKGVPYSVFYVKDGHIVEKKFADARLTYSVLLIKKENTYQCVLLERYLAKSLFVKLYFFEGLGLKYFKPFIKETDLTGRTQIYVYEVDWVGFLK